MQGAAGAAIVRYRESDVEEYENQGGHGKQQTKERTT